MAPLFAIRSENDLGVGDTASLKELVDWAANLGFRLLQLLPINETGNDNSPYMAISSVALEPTTISIQDIPDLTGADFKKIAGTVNLDQLRSGPVNYPLVKSLKRQLLTKAFENFNAGPWKKNGARARRFREFLKQEEGWLKDFALFRTLMDEHGTECWDRWPAHHATAAEAGRWLAGQKAAVRKAFEQRMRFHMYVQWIAFTQWRDLKAYCEKKQVALMGDIPFGISYYSSDVFADPEAFDLEWSGGAPPEPYFKDDLFTQKWGQNWGVPLYRWDRMKADGYRWWRQRVQKVRQIFHLFRIDHVLGFYRIYGFPWRPQLNAEFLPLTHDEARARTGGELPHFIERDDSTPENRERNRAEGDERLRVLVEEVGEHRLIGEDLGTVPDYVRPNLTSLGIAGFKIPLWERKWDGWLIDGHDYQPLSVVTYATHDHHPVRASWESWLKAIREGQTDIEGGDPLDQMRKLAGFARMPLPEPRPWSDEIHESLLHALFDSRSWLAIVMITDLFATTQRFNVPGAIAASNWSERLPYPVSKWKRDRSTREKMARVAEILQKTRRV